MDVRVYNTEPGELVQSHIGVGVIVKTPEGDIGRAVDYLWDDCSDTAQPILFGLVDVLPRPRWVALRHLVVDGFDPIADLLESACYALKDWLIDQIGGHAEHFLADSIIERLVRDALGDEGEED